MKRGLCFMGREHHSEKMMGTLAYFRNQGVDIDIFVANNVLNWDNYETPLIHRGLKYRTIYEFLNPDVMSRINANADLANQHINNHLDVEYNILNYLQEFFVRFSVREMVEVVELFREMLTIVQPDFVFILHECNFWTKPLAYLADEMKIPVISIQEGSYPWVEGPQAFSGLELMCEYSTAVYMWGQKDVDMLKRVGTDPERLIIVGAPHLDARCSKTDEQNAAQRAMYLRSKNFGMVRKVVLLAVPNPKSCYGNLDELVQSVIHYITNQPDMGCIVRFHPFDTLSMQKYAGYQAPPNVVFDNDSSIYNLLSIVDCCLVQKSTTGAEALVFGVPLVEICIDNSLEISDSFFDQGVADRINAQSEMAVLRKLLFENTTVVSPDRVREYIEYMYYRIDGKVNERIYQHTLSLI